VLEVGSDEGGVPGELQLRLSHARALRLLRGRVIHFEDAQGVRPRGLPESERVEAGPEKDVLLDAPENRAAEAVLGESGAEHHVRAKRPGPGGLETLRLTANPASGRRAQ